jgi:hypothetical protein
MVAMGMSAWFLSVDKTIAKWTSRTGPPMCNPNTWLFFSMTDGTSENFLMPDRN